MFDKFPCPCCGYRVFRYQPGHHEVCPICRWEDNLAQLRFPLMPGGANPVSLADAQKNFFELGCASRQATGDSREPYAHEQRDDQWRPLDPERDNIEEPERGIKYADSYPLEDTSVLYYWRSTYWRRLSS